jgi:hypothetical protein
MFSLRHARAPLARRAASDAGREEYSDPAEYPQQGNVWRGREFGQRWAFWKSAGFANEVLLEM